MLKHEKGALEASPEPRQMLHKGTHAYTYRENNSNAK